MSGPEKGPELMRSAVEDPEIPEHPTLRKLRALADFAPGWHFGEGASFTKEAIETAQRLHSSVVALGFLRSDAFPAVDGEIKLIFTEGEEYLDFIIDLTGRITFVREKNGEEFLEVSDLNIDDAVRRLKEIRDEIWLHRPFESFSRTTTRPIGIDSRT